MAALFKEDKNVTYKVGSMIDMQYENYNAFLNKTGRKLATRSKLSLKLRDETGLNNETIHNLELDEARREHLWSRLSHNVLSGPIHPSEYLEKRFKE